MAKILVCDDYAPYRELYALSFTRQGHRVITAENGVQAWNLFLDTTPDLILSDVHMPEMNGIDLVLALRRIGHRGPIILQSCGQTFIHGYLENILILSKPVGEKKLNRLVEAMMMQNT